MIKLDQSQLQRQVEIFSINGKQPAAQNILAGIGYDIAALDAFQLALQDWLTLKTAALVLLAAQKEASQVEMKARQAVQAEMSSLTQTLRLLFKHNPAVMTSLGLLIHHANNSGPVESAAGDTASAAEPGQGNHSSHSGTSNRLAVKLAKWRLLLTNLPTLTEAQRAELTQAGWGPERIVAAANLVEACATADTVQKQKIQAYRAAAAAAHEAEMALRKKFSKATQLVRLAIKQADPTNREWLKGLLGM